jgi:hypothetical protein
MTRSEEKLCGFAPLRDLIFLARDGAIYRALHFIRVNSSSYGNGLRRDECSLVVNFFFLVKSVEDYILYAK